MSENTTETKQPKFVLSNNGVEIPIYEHVIKKGKTPGATFLGPDFETLTQDIVERYHGRDKVFEVFSSRYRQLSNGIYKEAAKEADGDQGVLRETFERMFKDLSPRGETIKALVERRNELMEQLSDYDDSDPTQLPKILALVKKIRQTNEAIAEKRTKDEDETSDNSAPEVAKAA